MSAINILTVKYLLPVVVLAEYGMGFLAASKDSHLVMAIGAVVVLIASQHIFNVVQRSSNKLLITVAKNQYLCQLISIGIPTFMLCLGWYSGHAL